jgi:hypothetical protein
MHFARHETVNAFNGDPRVPPAMSAKRKKGLVIRLQTARLRRVAGETPRAPWQQLSMIINRSDT